MDLWLPRHIHTHACACWHALKHKKFREACVCTEDKVSQVSSSDNSHLIFWDTAFHWKPGAHRLATLTGQQALGIPCQPPCRGTAVRHRPICLFMCLNSKRFTNPLDLLTYLFLYLWVRMSWCKPGWLHTYLKPPASGSWALESQVRTTFPGCVCMCVFY